MTTDIVERLRSELRLAIAGAERDAKHMRERLHVANQIIERDPSEAAKEIALLLEENKRLRAEADIWKHRWEAERADHEHSIAWADKELKREEK